MSEKYVSPNTGQNHKNVYHTNRNCRSAENLRPASDHEINHHNLQLCEYCDPEKNPTGNQQSRGHFESLKEAAKNE